MSSKYGMVYDWSREATILLVQLHESHPCLYQVTDEDYHDRNRRNQALQEITTEFNRRKLTNLTPDIIKKKIHGIRTQYLSEVNKIKKSESSGALTDTIYKSKLWCFDALSFLQQGTPIVQGSSNMPVTEERESQDVQIEGEILYEGEVERLSEYCDYSGTDVSHPSSRLDMLDDSMRVETPARSESRSDEGSRRQQKRRKKNVKEDVGGLISSAVAALQNITKEQQEVEPPKRKYSLFGQMVAEELETISDEEIVDDLKEKIILSIYNAKRQYRQKKKH